MRSFVVLAKSAELLPRMLFFVMGEGEGCECVALFNEVRIEQLCLPLFRTLSKLHSIDGSEYFTTLVFAHLAEGTIEC